MQYLKFLFLWPMAMAIRVTFPCFRLPDLVSIPRLKSRWAQSHCTNLTSTSNNAIAKGTTDTIMFTTHNVIAETRRGLADVARSKVTKWVNTSQVSVAKAANKPIVLNITVVQEHVGPIANQGS